MGWFGEKCFRCNKTRTKNEIDGKPTCEKCVVELEAEREQLRNCPSCTSQMEKLVVKDAVIVDKCPDCKGVWLDADELELIQKACTTDSSDDFATGMVLGMVMG